MVQEQDDRSGGLSSSTWVKKLNHLSQPYTGFLQVSMQARYNCMQSQPGTSVVEMQSCLLGLPSGKIRLGPTVCNVGNETRKQGDFAFAKKHHYHLKYKLADLLWDLGTVSRRNSYVQETNLLPPPEDLFSDYPPQKSLVSMTDCRGSF